MRSAEDVLLALRRATGALVVGVRHAVTFECCGKLSEDGAFS